MNIFFTVDGDPVAKGRPRFVRRADSVGTYTPKKTASYETRVRLAAISAMMRRQPTDRPVQLSVMLGMRIPPSWSTRRHVQAAAGEIRATKKPDADNVVKLIKDACNGIVWRDDAQVVRLVVQKEYAERPGISVAVSEVAGEPAP